MMKFTIKENTEFSFITKASHLKSNIQKIIGMLDFNNAKDSKNFYIISGKGNIYIAGYSQNTFCIVKMQADDVTREGIFGISPSILMGLVKNYAEMKFVCQNSKLYFNLLKGKYKGELAIQAVDNEVISMLNQTIASENSHDKTLPYSIITRITEGIALTGIKDVYLGKPLLNYIVMENNRLMVTVYDGWHIARYYSKIVSNNDFRMALPVGCFGIISRFLEEKPAVFSLSEKELKISGDDFLLILPAVQATEDDFIQPGDFIKNIPEATCSFIFGEKLLEATDSIYSLKTEERTNFNIKLNKNKLKISFKSQHGEASDVIDITDVEGKPVEVNIDPPIFMDLLKFIKTTQSRFSIVKNKMYFIDSESKNFKLKLIGSLTD